MTVSTSEILWWVVGVILLVGMLWLARIAAKSHEESKKIEGFFLAGRHLGAPLTGHVCWATSFALANGLFYFSVLGYRYGLLAVLFQIPWSAAFFVLARYFQKIKRASDQKTLHGFLGYMYGGRCQKLSAVVTLVAILGVIAFEMHVSVGIIAGTLVGKNIDFSLIWIGLVLAFAFMTVWYVDAGGFLGTARTDKYQNGAATFALAVFIIGLLYYAWPLISEKGLFETVNLLVIGPSANGFEPWSLLVVTGIMCYAMTWNFVDPSNWQVWSANSMLSEEETKHTAREIRKAAIKMLFVPGLVGVLIGSLARLLAIPGEEDHFRAILNGIFNAK